MKSKQKVYHSKLSFHFKHVIPMIILNMYVCWFVLLQYNSFGVKDQVNWPSNASIYRVSHSKDEKVILLWWEDRFWFLLIFWVLHVHEIGPFMPNSPVFIFLMLCALYRMICKNTKSFFGKNSLNVSNVKLFSIFFSTVLAFLCLFGENNSLHFTY